MEQFNNPDIQIKKAILLSVSVSISILILKIYAFVLTSSTAIFSDALESIVHIFAIGFATFSVWLSQKPADEHHLYGHDKIGFFSAGFEGAMILFAAFLIIYKAADSIFTGLNIQNIKSGTFIIAMSALINGSLGWFLIVQGKKYHSLILTANGKHILTDSLTSSEVVIGLVLTLITNWLIIDPIIAIIVAMYILFSGVKLIYESIGGLMDKADSTTDKKIRKILNEETSKYNVRYHELKHRNAGSKLLIEFHLIFPVNVSIATAHDQATKIEKAIHDKFPLQTEIISHLEPLEDDDEIHATSTKEI